MNENVLLIEPMKGLGFLKLESSVNYVLSEIRSRGERYENADIVVSETGYEAIYVALNREGIKFRFDQIYQRLELIEIDAKFIKERTHSIFYKNNLLIQGNSTGSHVNNSLNTYPSSNNFSQTPNNYNQLLTYNYINSIFGPTNMPKLIDNNKFLLLRYEGISFLFENIERLENEESIFGSEAILTKISIFPEKFLIDSILRENTTFRTPTPLIKIDIEKGMSINFPSGGLSKEEEELNRSNNNNEIIVNFNERLGDILFKLQNPNYIFYKCSDDSNDYFLDGDNSFHFPNNYEPLNMNTEDCDFFLNYYSYGLDLLIDSNTHRVKKFIFHTNNPFDVKFGIYNRCNFAIELNKNFFRKLEKINEANTRDDKESLHLISTPSHKSRKISEDSNHNNSYSIGMNVSYTDNNIGAGSLRVEKTENLQYGGTNGSSSNKEYGNLGYKDNYNAKELKDNTHKEESHVNSNLNNSNCNLNTSQQYVKKRRENVRTSVDKEGEKSFGSMNESNISFSLNNSDIFMNVVITPTTNFMDVLNRVPTNSFVLYHRHEPKLNIVTKYYAFDGIIFEVMENYSIASVTLVKPFYNYK